jgi:CrcB protein
MKQLLLVFLGGGLGASLRWYFSLIINHGSIKWFPTLSVNLIGCFLLGLVFSWLDRDFLNSSWYLILATGFCGSLTTFSTFSLELIQLLKLQQYTEVIIYLSVSVIVGLFMVLLGMYVSKI